MKRFIALLIFVVPVSTITLRAYSQELIPHPSSKILNESNTVFTMPDGWCYIDTVINQYPLHHFIYRSLSSCGIYNKKKDIYMFIGFQFIRSGYNRTSDYAANNYYLNPVFFARLNWTPIHEKLMTSSIFRLTNVDTVAVFNFPLDTSFLGKYTYAKHFVLHKQDIGNWHLTFVAKSKEDNGAIDSVFRNTWGMIRFKSDSSFHPTFMKDALVGKFRQLRPTLNTKDSIANARNRRRMNFMVFMFNGNAAVKAQKYKVAKSNYLEAHKLMPQAYPPFIKIFSMYLDNGQTDSATTYWQKLHDEYLPRNPKLLADIKYGQSMLYTKKEMYDSAIVVNKQLLQLRPQNAMHIYFALGDDYRRLEKYKTAIDQYKKSQELKVKQSPKHKGSAYCNYLIGLCYDKLSDKSNARKYFVKAKGRGYVLPKDIKKEFGL